MARRLQHIIVMRPSTCKCQDDVIRELCDCPVTRQDIQAAEDTFGPNLGALKGTTVRCPNIHVDRGVNGIVPPEVLRIRDNITIAIDIMFVNKIHFSSTSRGS